jgi:hypothetical protein
MQKCQLFSSVMNLICPKQLQHLMCEDKEVEWQQPVVGRSGRDDRHVR